MFGGIDIQTKHVMLSIVTDRKAASIILILMETMRQGTIILSNGWASYNNVGYIVVLDNDELSYIYEFANHNQNFV